MVVYQHCICQVINCSCKIIFKKFKLRHILGYSEERAVKSCFYYSSATCNSCRIYLFSTESNSTLNKFRQYTGRKLVHPSSKLMYYLSKYIPLVIYKNNIKNTLLHIIRNKIVWTEIPCQEHDIIAVFYNIVTNFYIQSYVKNINLILRGRDTRQERFTDEIKKN